MTRSGADPHRDEARRLGYEPEGARAAWLGVALLGVLVGVGVTLAAVAGVLAAIGWPQRAAHRRGPGVEHWEAPGWDLERTRARERAALSGYAWVDTRSETVRIPLERALELVARERAAESATKGRPRARPR